MKKIIFSTINLKRSKSLVKGPGVQKPFSYRVIHHVHSLKTYLGVYNKY